MANEKFRHPLSHQHQRVSNAHDLIKAIYEANAMTDREVSARAKLVLDHLNEALDEMEKLIIVVNKT